MKSRPILYTADNAQLVHDGKKTQTRRIIKNPDWLGCLTGDCPHETQTECDADIGALCPYGTVGDQLWVREPYFQLGHWEPVEGVLTKGGRDKWEFIPDTSRIVFDTPPQYRKSICRENPYQSLWHARRGRFMPRKYSRTTTEITEIRAQRLNEISEEDAIAEGVQRISYDGLPGWKDYVTGFPLDCPRASYRTLWESINGPGSWEKNVWVWVITFRKL